MGRDKAQIGVGAVPLARRVAEVLVSATGPCLEVGPGASGLPHVSEEPAGAGPLAAVVAGWEELVRRTGEKRPAVVLACDLPAVGSDLVRWLAASTGAGSLVPVVDGRAQPLCARWSVADLERAVALHAAGERSLANVFGADTSYAAEDDWASVAQARSFVDVDTPEDLAWAGLAPPPTGDDWVALCAAPIATEEAAAWATLGRCGAVVSFLGTVRDHAEGREGVEELVYEAYERAALERMREVVAETRRRWPALGRVAVVHRLGRLEVGETAVMVVASAGHRDEAFEAGRFLIDTVKETVPIWKHERWAGGADWGTGAQPVRPVTS